MTVELSDTVVDLSIFYYHLTTIHCRDLPSWAGFSAEMYGFPTAQIAAKRPRNLNRRDSALRSSLVSVDLTSDEISATGGRQRFDLRRLYRPMIKILFICHGNSD